MEFTIIAVALVIGGIIWFTKRGKTNGPGGRSSGSRGMDPKDN